MEALVTKESLPHLIKVAKARAAKHRPQGEERRCAECKVVDCEPLQTALRFLDRYAGPPEPIIRPRE